MRNKSYKKTSTKKYKRLQSSIFIKTLTHKKIVDIQTPQVYEYKELFECYSFLSKNNITGMVDTTESMFKFNKFETHVIRGEESNLKITYK